MIREAVRLRHLNFLVRYPSENPRVVVYGNILRVSCSTGGTKINTIVIEKQPANRSLWPSVLLNNGVPASFCLGGRLARHELSF